MFPHGAVVTRPLLPLPVVVVGHQQHEVHVPARDTRTHTHTVASQVGQWIIFVDISDISELSAYGFSRGLRYHLELSSGTAEGVHR